MAQEIERKFWVKRLPDQLKDLIPVGIQQGYLSLGKDGVEVRLRKMGKDYFLTVKSDGTLQRSEYEVELTKEQFEKLWPATKGARLQKERYVLEIGKKTVEVDIYHQPLKGLCVAEVEFNSLEEASNYQPEPWMTKEITHLNFLKNKNLINYESIEEILHLL